MQTRLCHLQHSQIGCLPGSRVDVGITDPTQNSNVDMQFPNDEYRLYNCHHQAVHHPYSQERLPAACVSPACKDEMSARSDLA